MRSFFENAPRHQGSKPCWEVLSCDDKLCNNVYNISYFHDCSLTVWKDELELFFLQQKLHYRSEEKSIVLTMQSQSLHAEFFCITLCYHITQKNKQRECKLCWHNLNHELLPQPGVGKNSYAPCFKAELTYF